MRARHVGGYRSECGGVVDDGHHALGRVHTVTDQCPKDAIAIYSACKAIISVVAATRYDGVEALHAVRRLAALAPDHLKSTAQVAEDAVLNTINRSDTGYDGLACYALIRLVIAMELDILRTAN